MPIRVSWDPAYDVGHTRTDTQHRDLLARCDRLAGWCAGDLADGSADAAGFDAEFEQLKAAAQAHFEAELALLDGCGSPAAEDLRDAFGEFDYLLDEVATTSNFSRLELQRFIALWFVGHVAGTAADLRALLAEGDAPA